MPTKNCLLIDDDVDDQEIFRMCLKKADPEMNFRAIGDSVEAITILRNESAYLPDYIFIDVNMPKMNGIECLKNIRNIERLKSTEIYMYSTTSEVSSVAESKKLGATDFIIKPSKSSELKDKLSSIFKIVSQIHNTINH